MSPMPGPMPGLCPGAYARGPMPGGRAGGEFAARLAGADADELAELGEGTTDERRIERAAALGGAWHPVRVDTMAEAYSRTPGIGGDPPPAGSAEEKASIGRGSTQRREAKTMSCAPFSSQYAQVPLPGWTGAAGPGPPPAQEGFPLPML